MKYKVIYGINTAGGGDPDGLVVASFYTYAQAEKSATEWVLNTAFFAYLWDGSTWRFFT